MIAAPLLFALSIAAPEPAPAPPPQKPLEVLVLPIRGGAPEPAKKQATRALMDALSAFEGLHAVSLEGVGTVLGKEADRAIAACTDDPCLVKETQRIRSDALVAGTLDEEAKRTLLRLRVVDTSSAARGVLVRVSREVPAPSGDARAFAAAISEAAVELFPELAAKSLGTLIISGAPKNATVFADGKAVSGLLPAEAGALLRLPPGTHTIDVVAPGHRRFHGAVEVAVGQKRELEVEMPKNRSNTPYYLGGIGVLAGGLAVVLGATAQATADDWRSACPNGRCNEGFTRARYEDDQSSVDRRRVSANGLFVVSGLAIAAGVVWYLVDPGVDEGAR